MHTTTLSTDDAELLAAAHLDLLAAQAEGVTVLGRCDRSDLIHAAHLRATNSATVPSLATFLNGDLWKVAA